MEAVMHCAQKCQLKILDDWYKVSYERVVPFIGSVLSLKCVTNYLEAIHNFNHKQVWWEPPTVTTTTFPSSPMGRAKIQEQQVKPKKTMNDNLIARRKTVEVKNKNQELDFMRRVEEEYFINHPSQWYQIRAVDTLN
jgi:hypothetical protein